MEYLLQLQYIADPLHDYITEYFAEARAELSDLLTALNDEGVLEVTSGGYLSNLEWNLSFDSKTLAFNRPSRRDRASRSNRRDCC